MIPDRRHDIAELTRRRNALLPISHLPESVLAEIFDCYRQLYVDPRHGLGSRGRLMLLNITHVCHDWRAIASSYGKLWTDISAIRPMHVRHWLARSARCPLDVVALSISSAQDTRLRDSKTVCSVLEELPRIRTLSLLYVNFTKEQVSTSKWINSPAPLLQSLTIDAGNRDTYGQAYGSEDHDKPFCLTAMFLSRHLPSLKHLKIDDSRFLSHCTKFPQSLTRLAIVDLEPKASWKPHMISVMLSILDTLPSLESLELSWTVGAERTPVAAPVIQRPVTLPRMQDLTLRASSQHHFLVCLLKHLVFPSNAKIKIRATYYDEMDTTFVENIGAKLNGRGVIGDTRPLRSFFIGYPRSYGEQFVIKGWAVVHAGQATIDVESEPDIHILIDGSRSKRDIVEIIRTTCNALPLSQVENLAFGYLCLELKAETFMAISQNMPALHTLYICGWSQKHTRPELAACTTSNTSEEVKDLFPSLKNLHLEFLRDSRKTAPAGFLKFLREFLASKKERGAAVEKLHFRACKDVDQSQKKLLRGLAKRMITDPVGGARA